MTVVVALALLQMVGVAQEIKKDEVSGGKDLGRAQIEAAWNALEILSSPASPAAKREILRKLPARKSLKEGGSDSFAGLRGGLNSIGRYVIYRPSPQTGMNGKKAENILAASKYLISELNGENAALADEWLCLLWTVSLPSEGPLFIIPASGWKHIVETGTKIGLAQYLDRKSKATNQGN